MKHCLYCGEDKLLQEFHTRKGDRTKSGIRAHCKDCVRQQNRERNNRYKQLPVTCLEAKCTLCGETKPSSRFAKSSRNRTTGLRSECLDCHLIKQRPREATRRARKASAEGWHTADQRAARFAYFGNKCVACGSTERLEADHNIPLSRQGTNWAANLVPLCKPCNISKHTQTLGEFLAKRANPFPEFVKV
jgi:5-methylcytosine-specific restriction endonuclease McrA